MLEKHGTESGFNFHDDKWSGVRSMVQEILSVNYGASLASLEISKYISMYLLCLYCFISSNAMSVTRVFKLNSNRDLGEL